MGHNIVSCLVDLEFGVSNSRTFDNGVLPFEGYESQ